MDAQVQEILGQGAVRRLRQLLERRADAIVAIGTPSGVVVWASEQGSNELFGRELADFERHNWFGYVHPEDLASVRGKHERAVRGETVQYSCRYRTSNGDWHRVSTVAWPVQAGDEQLIVSVTVPPMDAPSADGAASTAGPGRPGNRTGPA